MTYKYSETTLHNGLRIVSEHSNASATAAIGFFVKTGARDETPSLMGVSHFLEHMMFKGTERMSAEEVDIAFDAIGAEHNAFTSGEMTAFWGAGLPEVIGDIHDILADILRPSLRQKDFDDEENFIFSLLKKYLYSDITKEQSNNICNIVISISIIMYKLYDVCILI